MKKFLLSLSALALSLGAFAQSDVVLPSMVTFNPADEEGEGFVVLASVNETIHVTMDKVPSVPVTIMYVTGNSFGIDMKYERMTVTSNEFNIPLTRESWGVPYNETFILNLGITFTYGEGDDIEYYLNEDDEPIFFQATYMTHDDGPAELVRTYPSGEWEKYFTFTDAYEDGTASLFYTKEVKVDDVLGTIQYFDPDGLEWDAPVEISSYTQGWSDMDGLYVVSFNYADAEYSAEDLSKIVIDITGVSAGNTTIVLDNTGVAPQNVRKAKKGVESGLATSVEPTNVYSVQGTIVKKNATDLSGLLPGMYIFNGKKVVVK